MRGEQGTGTDGTATLMLVLPGSLPIVTGYCLGFHHQILLDTGASHNVMPAGFYKALAPEKRPSLQGDLDLICRSASGDLISLMGWAQFPVQIGSFDFTTSFLVAEVTQLILGNEFFREQGISLHYEGDLIKLRKGDTDICQVSTPPPERIVKPPETPLHYIQASELYPTANMPSINLITVGPSLHHVFSRFPMKIPVSGQVPIPYKNIETGAFEPKEERRPQAGSDSESYLGDMDDDALSFYESPVIRKEHDYEVVVKVPDWENFYLQEKYQGHPLICNLNPDVGPPEPTKDEEDLIPKCFRPAEDDFQFDARESLLLALQGEYPALFSEELGIPPNHSVKHVIRLKEEEYKQPYIYPVPHKYRPALLKKLQEMEDRGFIQPSSSPYKSPVVIVEKPDGSLRVCVDFRAPNG